MVAFLTCVLIEIYGIIILEVILIMKKYSQWMADSQIDRRPLLTDKWSYDYGLVLKGMEEIYSDCGDKKYASYILNTMNWFVNDDGTINRYNPEEYNIDHVNPGKVMIFCHKFSGDEKYIRAMHHIRGQLKTHPRTSEGVYWHKKVYPYQIWLDGLYMAEPFMAQYIKEFGGCFDDIINQFVLTEKYTACEKTGLLYHAYDETKSMYWANPQTGLSKHFWGRAIGWYLMAIVDVLEYLPKEHAGTSQMVDILHRCLDAMLKYQQPEGVWYQIVDMPDAKGNYLEASASCMMLYALAKGILQGHLDREKYLPPTRAVYDGIITEFVSETDNGFLNLNKVVEVGGLGGNFGKRRDGSFAYYLSENITSNDPKGLGAFLKAYAYAERLKI